ncbi:MAG: LptF/LptG family permease [Thermaceae bacterium]
MLGRYLLKEVLWPYGVGVLLFLGLLTFDLLAALSGVLLSQGAEPKAVALLVLYRLPWSLNLALPLGLVFAILVALSRLIRQSELKAAYAGGVPPLALLRPLVLLSLLVGGVVLLNGGFWRPLALERYDALLARILYGEGGFSGTLRNQVYSPPGLGVYFAEEMQPTPEGKVRLLRIRVVEPDGTVYSGEEGFWTEEGWAFRGYVVRGGRPEAFQGNLPFPARFIPKESLGSRDPFDTTTFPELRERAKVDPKARFALYRRFSDALGAVLLGWTAAAVGLSLREAPYAFLAIVLLIFGYYVFWTLSAQLAHFDMAAWGAFLPNLAYGLLALGLTWRLR